MNTAVLVSGGVDSSVALHLLHEQGHNLTAFYLKIWLEDELSYLGNCPWEEDLAMVTSVCKSLGVPLEIIPLQREYAETVVAYTLEQVKQGYTPNPDIMCNQQVKFGAFYRAIGNQYDAVATGHYAQKKENNGQAWLYQAVDPLKDQTYFLSLLSQQQLSRALFPIGHMMKSDVRAYAAQHGLINASRKDSQGICFLGKISFAQFLEYHIGIRVGNFVEYESGKIMGTHRGFWFYTIGQRQGIGLSGGPWYVVQKNTHDNTVFISRNYQELTHLRDHFVMGPLHWITEPPADGTAIQVKLRHGPQMHQATLIQCADNPEWYRVRLHSIDQGIASGQFAVIYQEGRCLGGGSMRQSENIV